MLKFIFLLLILGGGALGGYWYGYQIGREDALASNHSRSLETKTEAYLQKVQSIEIRYTDKDGNIVIPKVQWDELKKRENAEPLPETTKP